MVGIINTVAMECPLSGKYHRHGERLEFLITQAAFLKEQDLSNEHIWQKLLEYLVIFVNDLRIHDGIFITKYSEYSPSYYPSITVRDNYIIPMLYQPILYHNVTLGMIPNYNPALDTSVDSSYNPWELINIPSSITDTMNEKSQLFQMGIYVVSNVELQYSSSSSVPQFVPIAEETLDIFQLLDSMFRFYSAHEIHPQHLLSDLSVGRFLSSSRKEQWSEYKLNNAYFKSRMSFLHHCQFRPSKKISEDVNGIKDCFQAIHQLVCDYIIVFHGHQLTIREVEAQYEAVHYNSAVVTPLAVFAGFRFMQLHKNLLRHWYHNGLLTTDGIVYQLCYGLRYRVEVTLTAHMSDTYTGWVTWAVTVMQLMEELLEVMKTNVLVDYTVEDCNRVSLLVWEDALIFLDQICLYQVSHHFILSIICFN
jgi:hypothetical protein